MNLEASSSWVYRSWSGLAWAKLENKTQNLSPSDSLMFPSWEFLSSSVAVWVEHPERV